MKIARDSKFRPITIIIETDDELAKMLTIFAHAAKIDETDFEHRKMAASVFAQLRAAEFQ